jgi:hypothetical protein
MKKNVVDDIKTAIEKKNEILKSLGDSAEKNQTKGESFVKPPDAEDEEDDEEPGEGEVRREDTAKEADRDSVEYKKSDSHQVGDGDKEM